MSVPPATQLHLAPAAEDFASAGDEEMSILEVGTHNPPSVNRIPPELLLQIFAHFDPPASDSTAHLSPTCTTASLRACANVCKRWNNVATRLLWRRPRVYDITRFNKLVTVAEGMWLGDCGSAKGKGKEPEHQTDMPANYKPVQTTYQYATFLAHLSLSPTLPEPSRHNSLLSSHLSRLLSIPSLNLTTLDISFCKGISNYTLQKCAYSLRHLTSLNLAGGGRSEICVIRLARECASTLRRLGLGWNEG
ncbi:hypothetical protein HK104_004851, partial [Borealophlyctis nickersoniae]